MCPCLVAEDGVGNVLAGEGCRSARSGLIARKMARKESDDVEADVVLYLTVRSLFGLQWPLDVL